MVKLQAAGNIFMVKLRAAGNIFKDLSQNIPSSEFALKELIKNSYEANSSIFKFDLRDDRIVISDDGTGMNKEDIVSLLTLSESNKKFGTKVHNRYISGQKGIGFFSVFKFGSKITVRTSDTIKPQVHTFSLDLNEIIKKLDISTINVPVHDKNDSKFKGTEIVIEDLNKEIIEIFKDLMNDPGESSRLSHCIYDPNFEIKIKTNDKYVISDITPSPNFESAKMAEVNFSSKKPYNYQINYNGKSNQYDIPNKYQKFLKTTGLELKIHVNIYNFDSSKTKIKTKDAPKIFYYDKLRRISPLLYINNSIFSDNDIYNIEINASSSSSYVFRQQTGYIFIFLNNEDILHFNADRTKINESKTYQTLKRFTAFISKNSQRELRKLINEEKKEEKNPKINKHYLSNSSNNVDLGLEFTKNQSNNPKQKSHILKDRVQIGFEYKMDDIVEIYDSNGTQKYKPLKTSFCPSNGVEFDEKAKTVIFFSSANYSLRIEYKDKIDKNNKEFSGIINATNKYKKKKGTSYFIECYVEESDQINSVISTFRSQLNYLYLSPKYVTVFVSSLRTFVEIVVRNIATILDLKFDPDEIPLKKLLKTVLSEQVVNDNFLNQMKNGISKKGLQGIYNKIILQEKESNDTSVIDVLNIFTHSGLKLLNLDDANKEKICINFLFSFLNYLLRHPKSNNKISHQ